MRDIENIRRFLSFEDWFRAGRFAGEWVIVGQSQKNDTDHWMVSGLLPNSPELIKQVLSIEHPEIHWGDGSPTFAKTKGKVIYLPDGVMKGEIVKPFVIGRSFHGIFPDTLEILQEFCLYHELYREDGRYIESISGKPVVKYMNPRTIAIRGHELRDFLSARQSVLVRYHDHRREVSYEGEDLEERDVELSGSDHAFKITIRRMSMLGEHGTISLLMGKDVILPYEKPLHHHYRGFFLKEEKLVEFIVGLDPKSGENILRSTKNAQFLTPVFFDSAVLQKYHDNPRNFSVEPGYLRHLDLWGIRFGTNRQGLVNVWLGDLSELPFEEQLHWRAHNIPSQGGIDSRFWESQLEAKFVDLEESEHKILRYRKELNALWESTYGFPLFKDLRPEQRHILKSLHKPVTQEPRELYEQILSLSILLQDSIDVRSVRRKLKKQNANLEKEKQVMSISLLEKFLIQQWGQREEITRMCGDLRLLQRLRTACSAHRLNKEQLENSLKELKLPSNAPAPSIFVKMSNRLAISLSDILRLLAEQP